MFALQPYEELHRLPAPFSSYGVTNQGRVISFRNPDNPQPLKITERAGGTLLVYLADDSGNRKGVNPAHLMAHTFLGEEPLGASLCFQDGDASNISAGNLVYASGGEEARLKTLRKKRLKNARMLEARTRRKAPEPQEAGTFDLELYEEEVARHFDPYVHLSNYSITNYGRVISYKGEAPRILKPAPSGKKGYLSYSLITDSGTRMQVSVARLMLQAFHSQAHPRARVYYRDGDPQNTHLSNLEIKEPGAKKRASKRKGIKGEDHPNTELTEGLVRKIRKWASRDYCQASLAKIYGVSQPTISNIVNRKTWKHI